MTRIEFYNDDGVLAHIVEFLYCSSSEGWVPDRLALFEWFIITA
ncbi:MAG: hypothetical protein ACYSYW_10430 [Planctomycetota bacterium]